MKKNCFTLLVLMIVAQHASAQLYAGLGLGYSLSAFPQTVGISSSTVITGSSGTTTVTKEMARLGCGPQGGILIGFQLHPALAIEGGYSMIFAPATEYTSSTSSGGRQSTMNSSLMNFSLGIKLSHQFDIGSVYMKMSAVAGRAQVTRLVYDYDNSPPASNKREQLYHGGAAWGMLASIGFQKNFSPALSWYAELAANYQRYSPEKGTITLAEEDGVNVLGAMTTREKEVEYLDEYTETVGPNPPDPNSPSKSVGGEFIFAGIGLNIGLIYRFGKTE